MKTVQESPQVEMPRYRSHKEVHALKIRQVLPDTAVGHTRFIPDGIQYPDLVYEDTADVVKRCRAREMGDPGYVVVYPDGFASWSPTAAFEGGYSPV